MRKKQDQLKRTLQKSPNHDLEKLNTKSKAAKRFGLGDYYFGTHDVVLFNKPIEDGHD